MKSHRLDYIFSFLLIIVVIFNLVTLVARNKDIYLAKFDFQKTHELYINSQFASDPNERRYIIDDPELFSYAGYQYVRGVNPTDINFEHPPLVKYFFGISIFLFGNASIIQILFGVLLLITIYLIGKEIFRNHSLSLLPLVFLSSDSLFQNQFIYPYLDLAHILIITTAILFFLKAARDKRYYFLSAFFLGLLVISKYLGFIAIPMLVAYCFLRRRDDFFLYLKYIFVIVPLVYLLTYLTFFSASSNLVDFIFLHEKIIRLYRSYLPEYPWGEIWRILVLGDWRVWFGSEPFAKVMEWTILWPLSLIATFIALLFLRGEKNEALDLSVLWSLLYPLSASFHVIFPRHVLPYLPFGYILLTFAIQKFAEKIKRI